MVPEICESDAERSLWAPHGASLAERCRVVVFDQRGTGESLQVPPADSARLLGSDLATVCGSLLTTPCCVVGHSMGGMAAMHAALDFPQSVSALGLVATTAGGSGLTLPSDAFLAAAVARYESGKDEPIDDLELAVGARFRSENRTLYEEFRKEAMTQPRTIGPEELAQVLFSHDVSQRLGDIAVQTVVICGTEDQVHPFPNSSFLAGHIAAARLVELEGAGHLLNVEASARLIDEIFALVGLV